MTIELVSRVSELEQQLRYWLIQHAMPDGESVSVAELIKLKKTFRKEVGRSELDRVVREAQLTAAKICLEIELPPYKPKAIKPSPELARWLSAREVLGKREERKTKQRKERLQSRITLRRRYPVPANTYVFCK
jgi:hypothetical protein